MKLRQKYKKIIITVRASNVWITAISHGTKSASLSHRINMSSKKKQQANDYINTRYVKVHNSLCNSCTKGEGRYLPCDLEMIPSHGPLSGKQKQ